MNFAWLTAFLCIAEEKSITQAAEKLHVSQSALSKQLKNLEIELNNELVVRSSQGIQLTEAGILLYERGKKLMQEAYSIEQEVKQLNVPKRTVIGCLPSIATSYLPTLNVSGACVFIQNDSETLIQSLLHNQVDVAIVDQGYCPNDLCYLTLFEENYVAIVHKDFALEKAELTLAKLQKYPLILHQAPCDSSTQIQSQSKTQQLSLKIIREVPNGDFIYGYVLSGEGVAIVPALVARNFTHCDMEQLPICDLTRTIVAVAKEKASLDRFFV
ncbi:TPA: LysR family transcriptional regulator [Enterococcus faecalis]|uniref:LysR family transcriptional regulator n=1 Tax=Enterococcus TaxID=1350 RepID=UPI000667CC9C|nr:MULTISPECIES: LysR family transcriptional regulator [Enterococcus]MBD9867016.1 LysR family transcriptional regulator [Enterococcus faecalis]MDN6561618.1 LysR family transcriptional regulator [Enterococcus sp.]MDN6776500.1 LysR family transcriptional regulator [Enterococcus sp.]MDV2517205.1 LysR family transcriptional regulator [Enterococcus faecalis]MDV2541870.1 LysR family transcriptional regulator [Enterococcus faecalis]